MLIIGAKGFAKELLQIFTDLNQLNGLAFFDDINKEEILYNRFKILKSSNEVSEFFKNYSTDFTIGVGNPALRHHLYKRFLSLGGNFTSTISLKAIIGSYDVRIGQGSNILDHAIFSNSSTVGIGCIIYYNVTITHDCVVGDFVELSPGVTLLGASSIGSFTHIGANATILPKVKVGSNVIIGAGAVVNRDIPDNVVAVGVPTKIIKKVNA
jgi:sugar O-acyltransferase (sialic acid O-acetyltransferase NeuD family)